MWPRSVFLFGVISVALDSTVLAQDRRGRQQHSNHNIYPDRGQNNYNVNHQKGDSYHRRGSFSNNGNVGRFHGGISELDQKQREQYYRYLEQNRGRPGTILTELINPIDFLKKISKNKDLENANNNFSPIFNLRFGEENITNDKPPVEPSSNTNSKDSSTYTDSTKIDPFSYAKTNDAVTDTNSTKEDPSTNTKTKDFSTDTTSSNVEQTNNTKIFNSTATSDSTKNENSNAATVSTEAGEVEQSTGDTNFTKADDTDDTNINSAVEVENKNDAESSTVTKPNKQRQKGKFPDIHRPKSNEETDIDSRQCEHSVTYVDGEQQCKNKLIFYEDFRTLQRSVWNVEQIFAAAPDYPFVIYVDHPDVIEIKNNNFVINTAKTEDIFGTQVFTDGLNLSPNCTGRAGPPDCKLHPEGGFIVPSIVSARLNTKNKFSFKYGKVEIRAKLPTGDWIYPILFLNPSGESYGKYYESGQIRVAFIEGNQKSSNILKGGVILGDSDLARNYLMKNLTAETSWADTYHKYQLEWRPDSITVSVDGTVYGVIKPPENGFVSLTDQLKITKAGDWARGTKLAPFDKEMYIQIGLGVGGLNFPDRTDGSKPWRNRERLMVKKFYEAEEEWLASWDEGATALKIDYIKVWAL